MSNTGAFTEEELELLPSRKRIVEAITELGYPAVIYEYVAMGGVESHYRHFLVDTAVSTDEGRQKIVSVFMAEVNQKCDIHFACFDVKEGGPLVQWVPCNYSERLCDGRPRSDS